MLVENLLPEKNGRKNVQNIIVSLKPDHATTKMEAF